MSEKSLYPMQFVRECGGPKFQNEAGYSRTGTDISAHCVAFGDDSERHDEYPTATSFTNHHSGKTITSRDPLIESSKISGSDIIKQMHSMNSLEKTLRMPLSLFEMADRIKDIPSPRKTLFHQLVIASGLAPNTVKMILCSTKSGLYPKRSVRKRIAKAMNRDVKILFPDDRLQKGSIVNVYSCLPSKNGDFQRFVRLLSEATHSSRTTVMRWLKTRRISSEYARKAIAEAIGVSISQLFPDSGELKSTPI